MVEVALNIGSERVRQGLLHKSFAFSLVFPEPHQVLIASLDDMLPNRHRAEITPPGRPRGKDCDK